MNAGLIMSETHISWEISDITIFPLAVLAHYLLLSLSHADTNMTLHSLAFFFFFAKHLKYLKDLFPPPAAPTLSTLLTSQKVLILESHIIVQLKLKIQTPETGNQAIFKIIFSIML